jgi:PAS domain S-box-containing protein
MDSVSSTFEPHSVYELSWTYAPGSMFAFDALTGNLINVNPAAEALSGYSREELIGLSLTDLHPEGERERVKAEFLKVDQQPSSHPGFHMQRKDGQCVPVLISSSKSVELDGRPMAIYVYFDLSVRDKAEKHLAQMEARYRGLLEAAPDGIVVVNQSGEIVLLNAQAEKQFGYRRDELLGQKVTNIIPEGFAERLIADGTRTAAEALAQQIGTGIELIGRRNDGSEFPIEIMLSPLESAEGTLVTAAIRDITVNKEREHRLTAQNWALSAYAGAALALAPATSPEELLKAICEAITRQSIYVLAFAGIAEDGPGKKIRVAAEAGKAVNYMHGMPLSWSEQEPEARARRASAFAKINFRSSRTPRHPMCLHRGGNGRRGSAYAPAFIFRFASRAAGRASWRFTPHCPTHLKRRQSRYFNTLGSRLFMASMRSIKGWLWMPGRSSWPKRKSG